METTTVSTAQAVTPSAGIDGIVSTMLTRVMDSMFAPKKWERSTINEGTVGSISHATGKQLTVTEGTVLGIVSYTDGSRTFFPSVEISTKEGVCLANIQGVLSLKKDDKVTLIKSQYKNKKNEMVDCLDVTGVKA